jgi:glutathione synthase/RimK-type ligase-like ATP-grasp enzyme
VTDVLLATCSDWPSGEPGAAALDAALAARGLTSRWAAWDDPDVDWAGARLVAVRSTWDYVGRYAEFVDWAREVEKRTRVLNGADVFAWNVDKGYLTGLGEVPVVPTLLVDDVAEAVAALGTTVLKPRVGAGGEGVVIADRPDDPRLADLPGVPLIAQPLVESIRTAGELSVFVIGGRAVSQVRKVPADGEIRAHEHRGAVCRAEPLSGEPAQLALDAVHAAASFTGRPLDYARVDMLRLDGFWRVSEIEATEPGLYLDLLPANAEPFADLVLTALSR